jgi:hypothetical protein
MSELQGMTHREHRGKSPTALQSEILILLGRHCQGESCEICSHRMQFLWDKGTAAATCRLGSLGRVGPTRWTALFEVGADEVDEVLGYFLRGERGTAGLHHVLADVVFEDLGHEAVDTARNSGLSTSGDVASPASTYAPKLNLG